jgi:ferredoxin
VDERKGLVPMKVYVDNEKCQGHLRCAMYAAEAFDVDEMGHSHPRQETVRQDLEDAVRKAVANCPENAISIVE